MASILVVEDYEMKLLMRALNQYKSTIFPEDDLNNDAGQTQKLLERFKDIVNQKYNGGREL